MGAKVTVHQLDGLVHLAMDDGKANAIDGPQMDELEAALEDADKANAAVVLSGRAGYFSGGLNLKVLPGMPADKLVVVLEQFTRLMLRLFTFPRPLVVACTGHALAGGYVTMLGADERVATQGAFKLGLNETQIGLSLPLFVVEMARAQLPVASLHAAVVRGDIFQPDEALRKGLVDEVVPAEQVLPRAIERAKELAALPSEAYRNNKLQVRTPHAERGREAWPRECRHFMELLQGTGR